MELKNYIDLKGVAEYLTGIADSCNDFNSIIRDGITCAVERIDSILENELPWELRTK